MNLRRLLSFLMVLFALFAAVGVTLWVMKPSTSVRTSAIGGPFALIDQNGQPFTDAAFKNKVALVFFGYTHCPDVCPTTLYDLSQVLALLPADAPVAAAFITIDPERDTQAALKEYMSSFDTRIHGLSGPRPAVEAAMRAYRVYAKKVPGTQPDDYSYDHTALVYMMDKTGNFVSALNLSRPPQETLKELQTMF